MGKTRTIVDILLGYIIGVIWGLYLNINIVFIYIIIFLIFKAISFTKIYRYLKLIIKPITVILIIISSLISNLILTSQNIKYENLYNKITEIEEINKNEKYKNTYLYINSKEKLEYGDLIYIQGEFEEPETARNYKGFNYKEYLKTLKIYGMIDANSIEVIGKERNNIIFTISNNTFLKIKESIEKNFPKNISSVLLGIMLGYTEDIDEEITQNFSNSNISHVLAVSGMHISYIVMRNNICFRQNIR